MGRVLLTNLCLVTVSINYLPLIPTDSGWPWLDWTLGVMRKYATLPPLSCSALYQGVINSILQQLPTKSQSLIIIFNVAVGGCFS